MKGRVFAVLLLVVVAVGLGVVVGVAAGGGEESENMALPPNIIVVSGQGDVSTAPDKATVDLGVNTSGPTAEEALRANAAKVDPVLKALADAGVADKDIQTQDMRLNKRVENRDTKNETVYYTASQQLSVTTYDVTKVGAIIDAAVQAGANDVGGVEFGLSDTATSKNAALKQAVDNAKAKAEALAAASGATVGPVVRIDENNYDYEPNYVRMQSAMMAMPSPAPATYVSPGEVRTEVTVRVTYQLIPAS